MDIWMLAKALAIFEFELEQADACQRVNDGDNLFGAYSEYERTSCYTIIINNNSLPN